MLGSEDTARMSIHMSTFSDKRHSVRLSPHETRYGTDERDMVD